jgi:hypothetical protein
MPYTPLATETTQPADTGVKASSAAAEFRTLKVYMRDILLAGINLRSPIASPIFTGTVTAAALDVDGALHAKAATVFDVSPTAPTPPFADATTKLATMEALAAATFATALPGAGTGKGLSLTSNGTSAFWGMSAANSLAVFNYLGA